MSEVITHDEVKSVRFSLIDTVIPGSSIWKIDSRHTISRDDLSVMRPSRHGHVGQVTSCEYICGFHDCFGIIGNQNQCYQSQTLRARSRPYERVGIRRIKTKISLNIKITMPMYFKPETVDSESELVYYY